VTEEGSESPARPRVVTETSDPSADLEPRPAKAAESSEPIVRDVIEALVIAIVLSLAIKQFVVEAYKVPTGSMEPTIHGDPVDGDRILVDRLAYTLREPRRWEVAVFRFPNNLEVNYIKRIIGMPEESLFLIGGDVYTAAPGMAYESIGDLYAAGTLVIQRKPRELQDAIFARYPQIVDGSERPADLEEFLRNWRTRGEDERWRFDQGAVVDARGAGRLEAILRRRVQDTRVDIPLGQSANTVGKFHVGDRRIQVEVEALSEGGYLTFAAQDVYHSQRLEARVPVRSDRDLPCELLIEGEVVASRTGPVLEPGVKACVSFDNVDDRLVLSIDGLVCLEHDYRHEPARAERPWEVTESSQIGAEEAHLRFHATQVSRDVHYRAQARPRTEIGADSYFMLGDNSGASKDSREWFRVTIRPPYLRGYSLTGDAEAVIEPDNLDARVDNPWKEYDADTGEVLGEYFMDRLGHIHDLGPEGHGTLMREPSPLVPRRLILGRAVAIFWPWKRLGLVR
jgi:signal peptidase S26 family